MTPPPCNCAHVQTAIVWTRGQAVERYDRCTHPTGPHPMHEWCEWRTPKTEGIAK